MLNRSYSAPFKTNAVFTKKTTEEVNREIMRQKFTYLAHWTWSRTLNRKATLVTHCSLQLWSKYRQSTQLGGTNCHFVLAAAMTLLMLVKGLGTRSLPLLYTAQATQTVRVCKLLIKKPKNGLLPTFSPDFTWNRQIWLFYAEKWIFFKKLGTLLKLSVHF